MIVRIVSRIVLLLLMVLASVAPATAREGDTLEPVQIDAPALETWPETLLHEDDVRPIEQRVREARNSGVPLAVRIIDLSLPSEDLPFQIRQYAREDFSQPISVERQQAMIESWANAEAVETSEGANDGFILLVLVPEDRTQTQAIWWIGPNALPLNGLTQENILATHAVMNSQFAEGNMPNGVFLGISEFSYNIQFGEPERLIRADLEDALFWATIPMAIGTAIAGVAIPGLAVWFSRRNTNQTAEQHPLSPWEAAALQLGRARPSIPAAMLLDSFHQGGLTPLANGGLRIEPNVSNVAVEALRAFANDDGIVDGMTMYEIESIVAPVRGEIEDRLAEVGAMTPDAHTDRIWMLLAMGLAGFLAVLSTVPSVMSMSAIGIFSIGISIIGIASGWWWLAYRSYTSPAGETMLAQWLETATPAERSAFDMVIHQDLLTDQAGGPDVTHQTQLVRQLRGFGSG